MRLILGVTLFVEIICICYGRLCTINVLERCGNDTEVFYVYPSPRNELEWQEACKKAKGVNSCIHNILRDCLEQERMELFLNAVKGYTDLLDRYCFSYSEFKQRYLKHIQCKVRASGVLQKCLERYSNDMEAMKLKTGDLGKALCCSSDRFRTCHTTVTSFYCGKGANDVTEEENQIFDCSEYSDYSSCILDTETAACYKKVSEVFESGLKEFKNITEQLWEQELPAEEKKKQSCCKFDEFISNIKTHAKSVCSSSGADNVLRDVIDPMGIENIRDICPSHYIHDSVGCFSAAISVNGANVIVSFITILLLALSAAGFICV